MDDNDTEPMPTDDSDTEPMPYGMGAVLAWVVLVDEKGRTWGGALMRSSKVYVTLCLPPLHDSVTGTDYTQRWVQFPIAKVQHMVEAEPIEAASFALHAHLQGYVPRFVPDLCRRIAREGTGSPE